MWRGLADKTSICAASAAPLPARMARTKIAMRMVTLPCKITCQQSFIIAFRKKTRGNAAKSANSPKRTLRCTRADIGCGNRVCVRAPHHHYPPPSRHKRKSNRGFPQGAKGAHRVFQKLASMGPRTGDDCFSGQAELVRRILVARHKRFDHSASPSPARWLNRHRFLSRARQARAGSGYETGLLRFTCNAGSTFPASKDDASQHS